MTQTTLRALPWEIVWPTPLPIHVQMALEEVLLERVKAGTRPPTLRLWEWQDKGLILGSNQVLENEIDEAAAASMGFTAARRMSGGGTMLVEPGRTVTYSLYLPESAIAGMDFVQSFAFLDQWAVDCLRGLGVPAAYRPVNDIVSPEGKLGGAAQARRRGAVVHHTTIALQIQSNLVPRLIRIGRPAVSARGVRSAEKVVSPLARWTSLGWVEIVERLAGCFERRYGGRTGELAAAELKGAQDLARSKYAKQEWIDRLR